MQFWRRFHRHFFALQSGPAHRVIFYYYGEEPTFLEDAHVTIFRNGVVEVVHRTEHVSTHAQNVEVLWKGKNGGASGSRSLTLVKTDAKN